MYKLKGIIILAILATLLSCQNKKILSPVPVNVSFNRDIMPVFNQSCNTVGCHAPGYTAPDLTSPNAYADLFKDNLVDTQAPEKSVLYARMVDNVQPMPPAGVLTYEASLVLVWIQEGAKDN
ncbi:hypothetical protein MNBD_BACTEROID07-809 [hydrothermal vent metagenome]|uniref:Cytochrome C Planctomycete-type domain-containing protein n=1 Tax=hydrothermal vent metagenome TaxID=652676 RepID=A0A3B0UVY4_9ZZZZ